MYLLNHGCEVNTVDVGRSTPLHWAAMKNNDEAIRLLIESGASWKIDFPCNCLDLSAKDSQGFPPAHYTTDPDLKEYMNFIEKRGLGQIVPMLVDMIKRSTYL